MTDLSSDGQPEVNICALKTTWPDASTSLPDTASNERSMAVLVPWGIVESPLPSYPPDGQRTCQWRNPLSTLLLCSHYPQYQLHTPRNASMTALASNQTLEYDLVVSFGNQMYVHKIKTQIRVGCIDKSLILSYSEAGYYVFFVSIGGLYLYTECTLNAEGHSYCGQWMDLTMTRMIWISHSVLWLCLNIQRGGSILLGPKNQLCYYSILFEPLLIGFGNDTCCITKLWRLIPSGRLNQQVISTGRWLICYAYEQR